MVRILALSSSKRSPVKDCHLHKLNLWQPRRFHSKIRSITTSRKCYPLARRVNPLEMVKAWVKSYPKETIQILQWHRFYTLYLNWYNASQDHLLIMAKWLQNSKWCSVKEKILTCSITRAMQAQRHRANNLWISWFQILIMQKITRTNNKIQVNNKLVQQTTWQHHSWISKTCQWLISTKLLRMLTTWLRSCRV